MYRIAICDDEMSYLQAIRSMTACILSEAGIPHEIEVFSRAADLKAFLLAQPEHFDILLLDILLGSDNGIRLAKSLRRAEYSGSILFISNSKDFFQEGYSVYPVQYLLKPPEPEKLKEALLHDYRKNHVPAVIPVPIHGGISAISLSRIYYVESLCRETIFHTLEGDIHTTLPLKEVKALAPLGTILQCHKSYLVPMSKIYDITRTHITLRNQVTVPIGRAFCAEAQSAFIEYLNGN